MPDDKEKLSCPVCGKVYTKQSFFDKHVSKCKELKEEAKEHEEKITNVLKTKVAEVNQSAKEYAEVKDKLTPKDEQFWMRFWGTLEGISAQNALILGSMQNIENNTNITKEVRLRTEAMIDAIIKTMDETNKIAELIASTPAVIVKGNLLDLPTADEEISRRTEIATEKMEGHVQQKTEQEIYEEQRLAADSATYEAMLKSTPNPAIEKAKAIQREKDALNIVKDDGGFIAFGKTAKKTPNFTEFNETIQVELPIIPKSMPKIEEPVMGDKMTTAVCSVKSSSEKAMLLIFPNGKESWLPKSTIHNNYSTDRGSTQEFVIDNWIVKKNELI